MLSDKRKTIGVFINRSDSFFIVSVNQAIQAKALALGNDVIFFYTVGHNYYESEYEHQEMAMFSSAPVEDLDGIIVAFDTFQLYGFSEGLLYMLESRAHCPIVFIRQIPEGCDGILSDDTDSIAPAVEHLIECHGAKRIYFMNGSHGDPDGDARMECCKRVLAEHNLSFDDSFVFYGDMWRLKGEPAYHYFCEELEPPDAVVCANDLMAEALIAALINHGFKVPEDILVTGFDNIIEAQESLPSITTVGRSYEQLGYSAVELIDRRIKERDAGIAAGEPVIIKVPVDLIIRESCGCHIPTLESMGSYGRRKQNELLDLRINEGLVYYFSARCSSCDTLRDLHELLVSQQSTIINTRDCYICVYDDTLIQIRPQSIHRHTTDNMILLTGFRDNKDIGIPMETFDSVKILPNDYFTDEPAAYYLTMLHHGTTCFGYLLLRLKDDLPLDPALQLTCISISSVLQRLHSYNELRMLSEENHIKSITDPLTGIYNRRGFDEMLTEIWDKKCEEHENAAFITIDLDCLKVINDTYGHGEGDRAICAVADAITLEAPDGCIAARIGGDEFLVFLPNCDEGSAHAYITSLRRRLKNYTEVNSIKYDIGVSAGVYSLTLSSATDVSNCIKNCDALMYHDKRSRKKANRS